MGDTLRLKATLAEAGAEGGSVADASPAQANRGSLERVIAKMRELRGVDLGQYRSSYLERRVATRLRGLGLTTYRQYCERLEYDPDEADALLHALTISVTDFFRDDDVWEVLRSQVLIPLISSKRGPITRTLRVWSVGCATGEEPYSLAMTLLDLVGDDEGLRVSVLGTDVDSAALQVASRGVYSNARLRRIPPAYQVRFTRTVDPKSFELVPEVRGVVRFVRPSLFDPVPMKAVDLITCRNLFIYLDRSEQVRALEMFEQRLARGGYLMLGRSEKMAVDLADAFTAVNGRERIFRKVVRS